MLSIVQDDLNIIREFDSGLWEKLRGKRIFATGCTGFIGSWLVHSFVEINQRFQLGASITLLTRNKIKSKKKLSFPGVYLYEGSIENFEFPSGNFDFIIHGATDVASYQSGENPLSLIDVPFFGTKRVLEFSSISKAHRVLFLSSGAVYGDLPNDMRHVAENYMGAPLPQSPKAFYGEGKRLSEMLLMNHARRTGIEIVSARIFTSCGPFLPLDSSYAFANFIKACLSGEEIVISGNGKSVRSYLYGSDLALWLWSILLQGKNLEAYNVGSEAEVSIYDLATMMNEILPNKVNIRVMDKGKSYNYYVPSTQKAHQELGLKQITPLDKAILKTFEFYKVNDEI